ncbi:MAG: transketolase [Clostridia bacterium]|nr:transketolase [Clostridia bacterium]
MLSEKEVRALASTAKEIRILSLEMIGHAGKGHLGGALSIADLLALLYFKRARIDPQNPKWEDRDRIVLSKGHAGTALYAALSLRGFFPREICYTMNQNGTTLPSHVDMRKVPGADMTAGSLAQGFSAAVGMALAARLDKKGHKVYTIIGDGESQEGEIWEAAMLAGNRKLSNLVAFCDNNGMQIDGLTDEINSLEPMDKKWEAFNWHVIRANGHDIADIDRAMDEAEKITDKPVMIILKTVKGKGVSFAEGKVSSHSMTYGVAEAEAEVARIRKEDE